MNLSDLLEVELRNDNLKMFNQAWEGTSSALGNDVNEHVLEKIVWTTSEKVYTHDACDHIISARYCSEKGAEKLPKVEDYGQWHPRAATAEHVHFTNRDRETEPQQHTLREELRKGKDSWFFMSKSSCSKGGKCSFDHDTAKKGQGKGNRSRSSVTKRQFHRKT